MKQDYLWDKSGSDPEIEGLENALSAFRYQETAPPALPAKVLAFPERPVEKTPRRRFSFAFAFAACAAAILIAFGVLFQLSSNKPAVTIDSAKTTAPQINEEIEKDAFTEAEQLQSLSTDNVEKAATFPQIKAPKQIAKQTAKQNAVKIRRHISADFRQNKIIADAEIKKPSETLTAEEKYAYDQLMLALSITGSKLKIVKDKVDGVEEQNAVFKDGR
jgi:hypothetical protein